MKNLQIMKDRFIWISRHVINGKTSIIETNLQTSIGGEKELD